MLAGQDNTRPAVGVTGGELKIGTFDGSKELSRLHRRAKGL